MLTDGPELHEIADSPGWDTKQHCTCGFESVSKCEQWKHASDELRAQVETAEAENQQLKSAGLYLDPLDQSATESDTLRVKRAQARDAADLRNAFTEALLARVETAERQRDELAEALNPFLSATRIAAGHDKDGFVRLHLVVTERLIEQGAAAACI